MTPLLIPVCRQQKQFEDMMKTLIKAMAELRETQQDAVFELAMEYQHENWKLTHGSTK